MKIGVVQSNPLFGERERNLRSVLDLISGRRADLWVFPEFFASGYQFASDQEVQRLGESIPDGPTTEALLRYSQEEGCSIVAGLPEATIEGTYNAAILVCPTGFVASYRKIHLFGAEKKWFLPGNRPFAVHDVGPARVGVMVCFDHLFPESARSLALQGADVLAHPSNLIIPDLAQRTMAVRALENGVFAATANRVGAESRNGTPLRYTGQSQIISPDGEILVRLSSDRVEAGVIDVDVTRARDKAITSRNDKLADRRPELYRLYGGDSDVEAR